MVSRAPYVTGALGEPLVTSDLLRGQNDSSYTTGGNVFADDLSDRLDVILTFISVGFNYTGPYFLM